MITDQTTYQQAIIAIATISSLGLLILFYFFMLKPKQDEKAKKQIKGGKVVGFTLPDKDGDNGQEGQDYDQIIDDYPTYKSN